MQAAFLLKKMPWHRRFSVKFAKFLRTPVLSNPSGRNLSKISNWDRCSRTSLIDAWDSFCKTYVSKVIQDTCQWKPTTLGQPKFNFITLNFSGAHFFVHARSGMQWASVQPIEFGRERSGDIAPYSAPYSAKNWIKKELQT